MKKMTETQSKISETGASNETIYNTPYLNEVETDIESSKKRKAMEPRAACWKHFEKYIDKDGAIRATCNYCGKCMLLLQKVICLEKKLGSHLLVQWINI